MQKRAPDRATEHQRFRALSRNSAEALKMGGSIFASDAREDDLGTSGSRSPPGSNRCTGRGALRLRDLPTSHPQAGAGLLSFLPPALSIEGGGCYIRGADSRFAGLLIGLDAGWSSPVARQAHNLKVVGSNPTPATISNCDTKSRKSAAPTGRLFCVRKF